MTGHGIFRQAPRPTETTRYKRLAVPFTPLLAEGDLIGYIQNVTIRS